MVDIRWGGPTRHFSFVASSNNNLEKDGAGGVGRGRINYGFTND